MPTLSQHCTFVIFSRKPTLCHPTLDQCWSFVLFSRKPTLCQHWTNVGPLSYSPVSLHWANIGPMLVRKTTLKKVKKNKKQKKTKQKNNHRQIINNWNVFVQFCLAFILTFSFVKRQVSYCICICTYWSPSACAACTLACLACRPPSRSFAYRSQSPVAASIVASVAPRQVELFRIDSVVNKDWFVLTLG